MLNWGYLSSHNRSGGVMHNVETVESGQTFAQALRAFEAAWVDPRHTAIELPPVDVNKVLADRYAVEPAVHMTRRHLWDMEVRKAWDPLTYIPYVVSEGKSWASIPLPGNGRRHLRSSIQKAWVSDDRGRVLEEVVTDIDGQRIIFLGHAELPGPDGTALHADHHQPLFHVEHAVGGTEDAPTNRWRILVLTDEPEDRYREPFDAMVEAGWLPGFIEIYIERDLGAVLRRR
ncbi:hypothetical protein [Pseudonocardia yunnanensis]|uniref:hypothetical protein n=1 Tax=Pseudonocardia yunnanensis TaxID=58107 RepID=UPI0031D7363D